MMAREKDYRDGGGKCEQQINERLDLKQGLGEAFVSFHIFKSRVLQTLPLKTNKRTFPRQKAKEL